MSTMLVTLQLPLYRSRMMVLCFSQVPLPYIFLVCGYLHRPSTKCTLSDTNGNEHNGFDCLIWAIGRRPSTDLNLEAAKVRLTDRGYVEVDKVIACTHIKNGKKKKKNPKKKPKKKKVQQTPYNFAFMVVRRGLF